MFRGRGLSLIALSLALLPFQNCAGNLSSVQPGSEETISSTTTTGNGTTTTTTTTGTTTALATCKVADVGVPQLEFSPVSTAQVLSGMGTLNGRKNSTPISLRFASMTAVAPCAALANVQCTLVSKNVTALDATGTRMAVANADIPCGRPNNLIAPGAAINITFQANDNDADKQCFEGTATFRVSLQARDDQKKVSTGQEISVTYKNNCYPEQITRESLDQYDQLGTAVAIDGTTAAVLAPGDDGTGNQTSNLGAVYIYERANANTWSRVAILQSDDASVVSDRGSAGDSPSSLALKSGVLAIGSEANNSNTGAVWVYKRNSSSAWSLVGKLSGPMGGGDFGKALALDSTQLAVGAPTEGAVYIYDVNTLSQTARISSPLSNRSAFGAALAIENSLLAVGAPGNVLYRDQVTGDVLLYQNNGGVWSEITTSPLRSGAAKSALAVTDQNGAAATINIALNSELGTAVAISSGVVIAGAPGFMNGTKKTGLALVIAANHTNVQILTDVSGTDKGRFGSAVSLGLAGAFVGAPDVRALAGAVDQFTLQNGVYKLARRITSHLSADGDRFGTSVATAGNNFVVGAKLNADPLTASGSASFFTVIVP